MDALRTRKTPEYLRRIIDSYLEDKILIYETENCPVEYNVTAGVPQGSVLGPFLWNLMYDGLLNLEHPKEAKIIGFSDDVAVVVTARTTGTLEIPANESLRRASKWLNENGLKPTLILEGENIPWTKDLRYFGVQVDGGLRHVEHVIKTTEKAATTAAALARLMPNVRGPKEGKRRHLHSVVHSKILYGAEIWAEAIDKVGAKRRLAAVQRRSALRVTSAYRTVSEEAALVLASTPPIDLLIRKKQEIYRELLQFRDAPGREQDCLIVRERASKRLMERWQNQWNTSTKGRWAHEVIPNIAAWYNRDHGQIGYYLTQALTGHGCFNAYLKRFKKTDITKCFHCGHSLDDARHTIFLCPASENEWIDLQAALGGTRLEETNMMRVMLKNQQSWGVAEAFVTATMKKKEEAERAAKEQTAELMDQASPPTL